MFFVWLLLFFAHCRRNIYWKFQLFHCYSNPKVPACTSGSSHKPFLSSACHQPTDCTRCVLTCGLVDPCAFIRSTEWKTIFRKLLLQHNIWGWFTALEKLLICQYFTSCLCGLCGFKVGYYTSKIKTCYFVGQLITMLCRYILSQGAAYKLCITRQQLNEPE